MNLVLHQLKKDILRTRIVLAFWLLLVVLQFALVGWNVKPGDVLMQSLYPMLSGLLMVFNYLLVLVLVPLLVHQEPLVGTTAFWFTRPLSRTTVLTSKALFVLMLVALPILAQSIVFLANGVTLHDVAVAAPQLLISQLSWILIIATLAVLTPNFARFAIVGAIVLVVFYLGLFVLQMVLLMRNPQLYVSTLASLTASRGLVTSLIMVGFGCGVVLLQYLTRRFALAVTLAVTGVVLSLAAQYVWPWDFLKPSMQLVQDTGFKANAVGAALTSSISTNDQMALRGGTPLKQIQGNITFKDSPKGYVIQVGTIDSTLKTKDGQNIPLEPSNQQFGLSGNIDPDAVELGLGGVPVLNMDNTYSSSKVLFNLDAAAYARYAATPLNYSASFNCTAYKYVIATELPLTKGARFDRGSEHLIVTDVLNQPNGVDLLLRQKNVRLLFAPRGQDKSAYEQDQSSVIYLLLNKARHQAVIQKRNTSYNFSMMNGDGILLNDPLRISFGPDDNNSRSWLAPQLDKAWLADAVLVRLDLTPVATFTRTLTIPGFRLDGKFNLPGFRFQTQTADLDTLDQITLPHDATRDQVRNYITDILAASRRAAEGQHDPQMDMLEKVGAQNVDLLIQMARDNHNYYLNHAINALAQPDHKEMVIEALATNHDLIDTIVDHRWQSDAKVALLKIFAETTPNAGNYPVSWALAIASLKAPSTYDSLKNYYIDNPNEEVFKALQSLPNFDMAGTVDAAWKKHRNAPAWRSRNMLQPAAQYGEPDVIEVATRMLKSSGDEYGRQRARTVLRQYTPATGATDADLIAWCESNKANLVFDRQAAKFVLRPQAAQPTPVKTGP